MMNSNTASPHRHLLQLPAPEGSLDFQLQTYADLRSEKTAPQVMSVFYRAAGRTSSPTVCIGSRIGLSRFRAASNPCDVPSPFPGKLLETASPRLPCSPPQSTLLGRSNCATPGGTGDSNARIEAFADLTMVVHMYVRRSLVESCFRTCTGLLSSSTAPSHQPTRLRNQEMALYPAAHRISSRSSGGLLGQATAESQSISIDGATQRTFISPGRKWTQMQGMPLSSADAAEKLGAGADLCRFLT